MRNAGISSSDSISVSTFIISCRLNCLIFRSLRQPWLLLINRCLYSSLSQYLPNLDWRLQMTTPRPSLYFDCLPKISSPTLRIWTAWYEQFLESAMKPNGTRANVCPYVFGGLVGFRISFANCRRWGIIARFLGDCMLKTVSLPVFYRCITRPPIHTFVERFVEIVKKTSRPTAFIVGISTVVFNINTGFKAVLKVLLDTFLLGCWFPQKLQTVAIAPLICLITKLPKPNRRLSGYYSGYG